MKLDKIGRWSEIKLDIIKEYAIAYSKILNKQRKLQHYYIDAFAGYGIHTKKETGEEVLGSPLRAYEITPKFRKYYFIDIDKNKTDFLSEKIGIQEDVRIINGDSNKILPIELIPMIKYKDFLRALCFLDPKGLHLDWNSVLSAGQMKTIEVFINFPLMDINRNVLLKKPSKAKEDQKDRLTAFWGDESWREISYDHSQTDLFNCDNSIKLTETPLIKAYSKRLKDIAGFKYVINPIPMRGKTGGTYYYIFFASNNATGANIARFIFNKYRKIG